MTKILFIAYYFPPLGGAGVQRSQKFVRYLPEYGILPTVVTCAAAGELPWAPLDESLSSEIPAEVKVHRTGPMPEAPKRGRMRRRIDSVFGIPGGFGRWWSDAVVETGLKAFDGHQAIVATMSPFETAEAAGKLSAALGIPWIADLRDPWALDEMQLYATGMHRRMEENRMERFLSTASAIVMNTPASADAVRRRFPSLAAKVATAITNGYDAEDFAGAVPPQPRTDGKFRIVHSGSLHSKAGLELRGNWVKRALGGVKPGVDILTRSHTVLMQALERWSQARPAVREEVEFVCAGQASKEDQAVTAGSPMAGALRFTGYVSHCESIGLVRTADLLFLPMHNLPLGTPALIVPGKTYEYIAAEKPILAAVPEGDVRTILEGAGTGLICRPDDSEGMVGILDRAFTAWKSGTALVTPDRAYIAGYERRALSSRLASVVKNVVAAGGGAR